MARPRKGDLFASLRMQGARILERLTREIQHRERELEQLVRQSQAWRAVVGGPVRSTSVRTSSTGPRAGRNVASGRSTKRVDWEEVLASVPNRFGIDDVMKHPGARAKGRVQIYPALTRWEAAKKIRRVGTGQYEKVSGRGPGRPASGGRAARRGAAKRASAAKPRRAKRAAGKASQNGRVDWDSVLKGLPAKFGAADVLKNPAAAAKGVAQVYPAIGRWVANKKAKKIGAGQYAKT